MYGTTNIPFEDRGILSRECDLKKVKHTGDRAHSKQRQKACKYAKRSEKAKSVLVCPELILGVKVGSGKNGIPLLCRYCL